MVKHTTLNKFEGVGTGDREVVAAIEVAGTGDREVKFNIRGQ